ncbi:hypothetical protein D3C77_423280 [compost metagenome]
MQLFKKSLESNFSFQAIAYFTTIALTLVTFLAYFLCFRTIDRTRNYSAQGSGGDSSNGRFNILVILIAKPYNFLIESIQLIP